MNVIAPPVTLSWYAVRARLPGARPGPPPTAWNVHAVFASYRDAEDWAREHRAEWPETASVEIVEIVDEREVAYG